MIYIYIIINIYTYIYIYVFKTYGDSGIPYFKASILRFRIGVAFAEMFEFGCALWLYPK